MSSLDDTTRSVEAARTAIDAARDRVGAGVNEAHHVSQQAAGLGLEGVAVTVASAQESLEAAVSRLAAARDGADGALAGLKEVTAKTGTHAAAERLSAVGGLLDHAAGGVDAADASTRQAYAYARQAEVDGLSRMIAAVLDDLPAARQAVRDAHSRVSAYRRQVEGLGRGKR